MSKRAEEAALKAYPINMQPIRYPDYIDQFGGKTEIDVNSYLRCLFQEGYELAEKELGLRSVEESLPPVDEEVIVLRDELNGYLLPDAGFVGVGHIVNPELTVEVDGISYTPMSYSGWNVDGVKYWMPMPKLPNEE